MHTSQADRSVIAARAARRSGARRSTGTVGTNPARRDTTQVYATGPVRRSTAVTLTATQRNSEGKRSEWSASPQFFTDPRWSLTAHTNPA